MLSGSDKTIKIEVTVENGKVSFPEGIDEKALKQPLHTEMVLSEADFVNKDLFHSLKVETNVDLLAANTRVLVNVSLKAVPSTLSNKLVEPEPTKPFGVQGGFVELFLLEPQKLKLRGGKKPQLHDCKNQIPALDREAKSLNHAYTLISTAFEPWRLSHAGNVFRKVFWQETGQGEWKELEALRQRVLAQQEREHLAEESTAPNAVRIEKFLPSKPRVVATGLPVRDRSREYAWLERHRDEYDGKYVALDGDKLLAVGDSVKEVMTRTRELGVKGALIVYVEGSSRPRFISGGVW